MGHREECQWGYRRALCCVRQEHANLPSAPCARCRIHRASKQLICARLVSCEDSRPGGVIAWPAPRAPSWPLAATVARAADRRGVAQLMRDVALSSGGGGAP